MSEEFNYQTELESIQKTFKKRQVKIVKPRSDYPELVVTVPDSWKQIQLAPLYDVHIGSGDHDAELFAKHLKWIRDTPDVLSFNGGDAYDNATKYSPGGSVVSQRISPEQQLAEVVEKFAPIQHKMLFSLPGNHEDRTYNEAGSDSAKRLANDLKLPYFPDYCMCTIKWRGNNFRLLAHHGAGGATTAGAQLNSARKDLAWAKFDIVWTGHLHQQKVDIVYQTEYDQRGGGVHERDAVVIISPSYVKYFGSYAAKKRMQPGSRGLCAAKLQEDGNIYVEVHARGKRL